MSHKIRAVVLDFYGTVVEEAYRLLAHIAAEFLRGGARLSAEALQGLWWEEFRRCCDGAYGENFLPQKELYRLTLQAMATRSGASVDVGRLRQEVIDFSLRSPLFPDAARFVAECRLPYYILSNADTAELQAIVARHGLRPQGIMTSEEAREYKPRRGIFEKGLQKFGLRPEEAIYAGDSLRNDFYGAAGAGMRSVWLNRRNEQVPAGIAAVPDLYALLAVLRSEGVEA